MEGADESLTLLAAGAHFSAAVSSRGHLYVWGEPVLAADTRARSTHDIFLPQTSAEEEHNHLPRMARASAGSTTLAASGSSTIDVTDTEAAEAAAEDVAVREVLPSKAPGRALAACAGGFHFLMVQGGGEGGGGAADPRVLSWGENAAAQLCRVTTEQIDEAAAEMDPPPPKVLATAPGDWLVGCGAFHSLVAVPGVGLLTCGTPNEVPVDQGAVATASDPSTGEEDAAPPPPPAYASAPRAGRPPSAASERGHGEVGAASTSAASRESAAGGSRDEGGTIRALTHVPFPNWDPASDDPIASLATGHAHSLALTKSGRLFSWGSNELGQLGWAPIPTFGLPDSNREIPAGEVLISPLDLPAGAEGTLPVRTIAAGAYHSLLATWSGEVWSFGCNSHGQLGRAVPTTAYLAPHPVQLPPSHVGQTAVALAAGLRHSVILLRSGAVCTFGDHSHGQLGREAPHRGNACAVFTAIASTSRLPHAPPPDATAAAAEGEDAVQMADRVVALAAGEVHSLALTASGAVYTWGDNQLQQCARDLEKPLLVTPGVVKLPLQPGERVTSISAAGYHGAMVTTAGRVLTVGKVILASDAVFDDEDLLYPREGEENE